MDSSQEKIQDYNKLLERVGVEISTYSKNLKQLTILRLLFFLLAIAAVYFFGSINLGYGITGGIFLLGIFFYFIVRYIKVQTELTSAHNLKRVLENEIGNLQNGDNLYSNGTEFSDPNHPYTDDLDIFGEFSVFHNINRCSTRMGNEALAKMLKEAASKGLIERRQEAVHEIRASIDQTFAVRATLLPLNGKELNDIAYALQHRFKKVLEFTSSKALAAYAAIAPYLFSILLLAAIFTPLSWHFSAAVCLLNYFLTSRYSKDINYLHELIGKNSRRIKVYGQILEQFETRQWKSVYLQELIESCSGTPQHEPSHKQMQKLAYLTRQLDYRLNIVVAAVLNLGFLWDIRCAFKIRKWHDLSSDTVVRSFETLGHFEALISLSTLSYNNPDWVFPQLEPGFVFRASLMGHPLISAEKRVYNDFKFEPYKTVDIITGSNMSGKSTFLRTIGANMVLAYAGAPVCADNMSLSIMKVMSYMRIKDSLGESTSTFKAEINRLKMIIETSASCENSFALIDEMLRGTNSRDKYLGTKAFVKKLISQNSAAIIATHDLQVAELEAKYPEQVRNFHFDIKTDGEEMYFDYKIKTGECKTFNASILLKKIGLDISHEDSIRDDKVLPSKS